jgi:cobalt-precorrin-5B (C1)-methyltransferase
LKYLRRHPLPRLTIAGGFAKLSKLAAGALDLHSSRSQVNAEALATLARNVGADAALAGRLAAAPTAMSALSLATEAGVDLAGAVAARARATALGTLRGAPVAVDVMVVDRSGNIVAREGAA